METVSWQAKELTPGQLAQRAGVSVSALHFYEREGLIGARRTSGNQRRYPRETLRRVAFIRISQRVGIPLAEIRKALDNLPDGRNPTRRDWENLSTMWREDLDERIEQLIALRDNLTGCIGCGCLSLGSCKIVNAHDHLGDAGPGARMLDVHAAEKCTKPEQPGCVPTADPSAGRS
ncbi:redox-sensitive transcriptional activator SoxR [Nocardia huaxiensis]|uniref:Redox-sensitive transcriptional activator SoxR n=1 Tax=Nocardia huaxiensis TaxID=2755382 RepID=A0A7D6ZLE7_9NOCA|nr:redox-sensitive transcriptional activator SoxR [Nocardia huaxiensis]QLY32540.1 redox-sensitive transcriptional activator SoxR [Nocardia huaxiensis]UFS93733.1 redox-sensitive transcriptional activator SoxR [Nocardia huaxiensis]